MKLIDKLLFLSDEECKFCMRDKAEKFGICQECLDLLSPLSKKMIEIDEVEVYSPYLYTGILKKLIIDFKYHGKSYLYEVFSKLLYDFALKENLLDGIDLVIGVPVTKKVRSTRGFNQIDLLASFLVEKARIPYDKSSLVKIKETKFQHNLNAEERLYNLEGVFSLSQEASLKDKRVLLVDDICTTGITLKEAIKVIKLGETKEIRGLTLARASDSLYNQNKELID